MKEIRIQILIKNKRTFQTLKISYSNKLKQRLNKINRSLIFNLLFLIYKIKLTEMMEIYFDNDTKYKA